MMWLLLLLLTACHETAMPIRLELPRLGGGEAVIGGPRTEPQLLYFWSMTCGRCLQALPLVERLNRELQGKAELTAIPLPTDPPALVANFAQRRRLAFPIAFDLKGEAFRLFRIEVIPLWVLLDCSGRIRWRQLGEIDLSELRERLKAVAC